jgi:two-component sensor histidine kinase
MSELELDVDTAIPLGLIANELITNSLKYAFLEGRKGKIEVSLILEDNRQYCLRVSDNGLGIQDQGNEAGTGFGSRLIQLLAIQLNGKVEIRDDAGVTTLIKFQPLGA